MKKQAPLVKVSVRVSGKEQKLLAKIAKKEGISVSALVRSLVQTLR